MGAKVFGCGTRTLPPAMCGKPFFIAHMQILICARSPGALEPPSEKPPRTLIKCIVDWLNRRRRRRTPELTKKQKWIEYQRNALNAIDSNWLGLRLEYRVKHGPAGFGFHDRFLIFPRTGEDALAWSLGTSVNGIGMEHHILQRVDNGQLIRDAFLELWEQLDQPEHLIWKKP